MPLETTLDSVTAAETPAPVQPPTESPRGMPDRVVHLVAYGAQGCGKSTALDVVEHALLAKGWSVVAGRYGFDEPPPDKEIAAARRPVAVLMESVLVPPHVQAAAPRCAVRAALSDLVAAAEARQGLKLGDADGLAAAAVALYAATRRAKAVLAAHPAPGECA